MKTMMMTRRLAWVATCACLLVGPVLVMPTAATAKAKNTPRKRVRKAHKSSKKAKAGSKKAKKSSSKRGAASLGRDAKALQTWLRAEMAAAKKKGKSPDVATQLLAGLFQLGIPNLVHGHYALAGTGYALQSGKMTQANVAAVAGDVGRNLAAIGTIYKALGAKPELKGQIGTVFTQLAKLTVAGTKAAAALKAYAGSPNNQASASAFDRDLEAFRGSIQTVLQQMR